MSTDLFIQAYIFLAIIIGFGVSLNIPAKIY